MKRVERLLAKWDVPHLLHFFEEKKVDFETLRKFRAEDLKEILPFREFIHVRDKFSEWFGREEESVNPDDPDSSPDSDPEPQQAKRRRLEFDSISEPGPSPGSSSPLLPGPSSGSSSPSLPGPSSGSSSPLLSPLANEVKSILLNAAIPGLILLRKPQLEEVDRNKLSELIIVKYLHDDLPRGLLRSDLLIKLSKAVVELFPEEDSLTYYVPYVKKNNTVFHAKGKFVNAYNLWRQKGIEANVIHSKKNSQATSSSSENLYSANSDENAALTFVRSKLQPVGEITQMWNACCDARLHLLNSDPLFQSIHNYFSTFPVLRQDWGYKLLLQDYDKLHPNSESLLVQWPTVAHKLLKLLLNKRALDPNVVDHLKSRIDDEGNGCSEILVHFSLLFPAQVVCKGAKGKHWTATKEETQEGFFKHVPSKASMNDWIVRRKAKLAKYSTTKKPLPFQPVCIVVGPSISQIEESFSVVANETYKLNSPIEALDATFKIIHALDLSYSSDSLALWQFWQEAIYKITNSRDVAIPCLPALRRLFSKC